MTFVDDFGNESEAIKVDIGKLFAVRFRIW